MMAPRESAKSLRIRWSTPIDKGDIDGFLDQISSTVRPQAVTSRFANITSLTATFEDTRQRDVARQRAIHLFPQTSVDVIFNGITVLSNAVRPGIDICAVHGLGGHAADSFTADDKIWLRDFLPSTDGFTDARISTFGYTSALFDRSADDKLSDWADYLLEALCHLRASTGTTSLPLILVCHSMGGLVVRHAIEHLFQYPTDHRYAGLSVKQCAALFLSTPHEGTAQVEFGGLIGEILKSTFGLRQDLVTMELQRFNESSARAKRTWNVMKQLDTMPPVQCLTESTKTAFNSFKSAMVLEQSSASFGSGLADKLPDTDHFQVCKFRDVFSPAFNMVVHRMTLLRRALLSGLQEHSSLTTRGNLDGSAMTSIRHRGDQCSVQSSTTSEYISTLTRSQPHSMGCNVYWTVSRPLNGLFTGREGDLQHIEGALLDSLQPPDLSDPRRFLVTGMGGQGKSEICLRVAHRLRAKFWGVFWVDVTNPTVADSDFTNIARRLDMPAGTTSEILQELNQVQFPWLLVLDNADDPFTDYQIYLPNSHFSTVIITSRTSECSHYATIGSYSLDGLDMQSAQNLLLKAAKIPHDHVESQMVYADKIAASLGCHPLALIQAGTYVSRGHCLLSEYLQVFESHRGDLLRFHPRQAQSRYGNIFATLEASGQTLASSEHQAAKDALDLLSLLAVLNSCAIPLTLFKSAAQGAHSISISRGNNGNVDVPSPWHLSRLIPMMKPTEEGDHTFKFRFQEARHLLSSLALTTESIGVFEEPVITMHPLTHVWAHERLNDATQDKFWTSAGATFALSTFVINDCRRARQLRPHLHLWIHKKDLTSILSSRSSLEMAQILYQCLREMLKMRDDDRVNETLLQVFGALGIDPSQPSQKWLPFHCLLVRNLSRIGQTKQAIQIIQVAIHLLKNAPEHDIWKLRFQRELVKAYRYEGYTKQALKLAEQIYQVCELHMTDDNLELLLSWRELARVQRIEGQSESAISIFEKLIEKSNTIISVRSRLDRYATQTDLGLAYRERGRLTDAERVLEDNFKRKDINHSMADIHWLVCGYELGKTYLLNKRTKEALVTLKFVCGSIRKMVKDDHPHCLSSHYELGKAYYSDGQFSEAIQLWKCNVDIRRKTMRPDHPDLNLAEDVLRHAIEAHPESGQPL